MNYLEFCDKNCSVNTSFVNVGKDIKLFQIHFKPKAPSNFYPIVFIPGWGSLINSWQEALKELTKYFDVIYIETREKRSAQYSGYKEIDISLIGNDISKALTFNNLKSNDYIIIGSSLGATSIIDAIAQKKIYPALSVLISPNAEFNIPAYWVLLIKVSHPVLYFLLKPLVKCYMKLKYLDIKSDPSQYYKYAYALDQANPYRLRRSVLSFYKYKVWDKIDLVKGKVLIIFGSKDIMHDHAAVLKISEKLSDCTVIDLKTNKKTHSVEMVKKLTNYIKSKEFLFK